MRRLPRAAMVGFLLSSALLTGCGAGSGGNSSSSNSISGTAAGGAPIIGSLSIKDSAGKVRTAQINPGGNYAIDVSGMTAPFVLKADGVVGSNSVTVTSLATSADVGQTVNVTPLTELITSSIAKTDGASFYNNFGSAAAASVTAATIQSANQSLVTMLNPLMTKMSLNVQDLVHTTFTANHTGLDGMLDVLQVSKNAATNSETIQNKLDGGAGVNLDLANGTYDSTITATTDPTTTLTALQAIQLRLNQLSGLFTNGTTTRANVLPYLVQDSSFLFDGYDYNSFASTLAGSQEFVGAKFGNAAIHTVNPDGSILVDVGVHEASGTIYPVQFLMKKDASGTWLIDGDQKKLEHAVTARTILGTDNSVAIVLGLYVDNTALANLPFTTDHVLVKGPGLPSSGVELIPSTTQGYMGFPFNGSASGNELGQQDCVNNYPNNAADCHIGDGTIPDNAQYTFEFYQANQATPSLVETSIMPKAPDVNIDTLIQSNAAFAYDFSAVRDGGDKVLATWFIPANMFASEFMAQYNTTTGSAGVDDELLGDQTTFTAIGVGYPTNFSGRITTKDVFQREYARVFNYPSI